MIEVHATRDSAKIAKDSTLVAKVVASEGAITVKA
jgi:hypothetical protein